MLLFNWRIWDSCWRAALSLFPYIIWGTWLFWRAYCCCWLSKSCFNCCPLKKFWAFCMFPIYLLELIIFCCWFILFDGINIIFLGPICKFCPEMWFWGTNYGTWLLWLKFMFWKTTGYIDLMVCWFFMFGWLIMIYFLPSYWQVCPLFTNYYGRIEPSCVVAHVYVIPFPLRV